MLIAFILICIHYIADFICQDEQWALNKSKSNLALIKHTATYTYIFILMYSFYFLANSGNISYGESIFTLKFLLFFSITFVTHTITDYSTRRIVSKKFANKHLGSPIPNFGAFSMIGFDQVIHYGTLFLTYHYVIS